MAAYLTEAGFEIEEIIERESYPDYIIGADGKIITDDREKEIEELIAPLLAK